MNHPNQNSLVFHEKITPHYSIARWPAKKYNLVERQHTCECPEKASQGAI